MSLPSMMAGRLPVTVLSGFLGAGKTTLLNHILYHRGGRADRDHDDAPCGTILGRAGAASLLRDLSSIRT